jgi:sugar (pentulose or hexulose) kinase
VITIGSTIVWKALASRRIDAPARGIYSHRGPDDWWLPGAASSAGARILSTWASPAELEAFDDVVRITPDTPTAYPSVTVGERFPFVDPTFAPWPAPTGGGTERYAAEVLGAALVERWGTDALVAEGCEPPETVATTGGATASGSWTRLRAAVLGVPIEVPSEPSAAYGAAVIAASTTHGGPLEAGAAMVRIAARVEPEPGARDRWNAAVERFRLRCVGGAR